MTDETRGAAGGAEQPGRSHDAGHNECGEQFLTFSLAGESYGLDILRVNEIRGWSSATRLPNTPDWVKGVINLRGVIVPVLDLRSRFALPAVEYTATTVVIVVTVETESDERTVGLVVDGVSDVVNVAPEAIQNAPDFGAQVDIEFIRGLASVGEQMVMLLDIDRLLSNEELAAVASLAEGEQAQG